MAAVLLRLAGRDPLGQHAGLEQLDREARQPGGGQAGERRAVVAAQNARQAVFAKGGGKDRPDMGFVGATDGLAAEQEPAGAVAEGKRLDLGAVAGQEPALEVGAPHVIRRRAGGQWHALRGNPAPALARPAQSGPVEHQADRARRRPAPLRSAVLEPRLDLARAPARVALAHRQQRRDHVVGERARVAMRRARPILETTGAFRPVTRPPLVAGLAADPEVTTQRRHALLALPTRHDEADPLIHHTGLLPRHGRTSRGHDETCHPCRRSKLSPIYPVWTRFLSPPGLTGGSMAHVGHGLMNGLPGRARQ